VKQMKKSSTSASVKEPRYPNGYERGTLLLPPLLRDKVDALARRRGWSFTQAAAWCIEQFLKVQRIARKGRWS